MGLFEKKTCLRCQKELGLIFGKTKIADGYICKDCNALLSPLLTNRNKLTLDDIEEHLKYREQNKNVLNSFKATTILGDYEKVYFDDHQKNFFVSSTSNYLEKNVDVFNLKDIISCEIKITEDQEELFQKDDQGNEVSYDPKKYLISYSYKIEIVLNHPWINNLEIDVSNGEIKESFPDELLRIDNLANEIMAKLKDIPFEAKTSLDKEEDTNHWECPHCGFENELTAKFCVNCGDKKTSFQKYCGECGTKLIENTKFCPNCGKMVG